MTLEKYILIADDDDLQFTFTSEGPKGNILKMIQFTNYQHPNFFNLGFGDVEEDGSLNDEVITNNGDMDKVLATIVSSLYAFTFTHPSALVYASGSTPVRTRLYRIHIVKHLPVAEMDFEIFGQIGEEWEKFSRDRTYEAFLVKRKFTTFEI